MLSARRRGTSRFWFPTVRLRDLRSSAWRSSSQIRWRFVVLAAFGWDLRRPLDDLLEEQVHEQEQRLGLEHQQHRFLVRIVIEMLVHAGVLDQHHVAGL